jgi:hypothetical protein
LFGGEHECWRASDQRFEEFCGECIGGGEAGVIFDMLEAGISQQAVEIERAGLRLSHGMGCRAAVR